MGCAYLFQLQLKVQFFKNRVFGFFWIYTQEHAMFITALFTIAKIRKQSKSPSTDEWIKKMCSMCVYIHMYIHTMQYYSVIKRMK